MTDLQKADTFSTAPGFCSDCGSILPPLREKGGVACYTCSREFSADCKYPKIITTTYLYSHIIRYSFWKNASEVHNPFQFQ